MVISSQGVQRNLNRGTGVEPVAAFDRLDGVCNVLFSPENEADSDCRILSAS